MTPQEAPYGTWSSPVSEEHAAHSVFRLGEIQVDGDDVYWTEERPEEGGRVALVHRGPNGGPQYLGPTDLSVRSRVYEYGGGSFAVHDGAVYAVHDSDQRVWRITRDGCAAPLTPPDERVRYADLSPDASRSRLVGLAERAGPAGAAPTHELVAVPLSGGRPDTLLTGPEFLCSPRVSPDGGHLAWIQWAAPDMPWDGTELWLARLDGDGRPRDGRPVAGRDSESVLQPQWGPDGSLHFVSDRSGFWNLYRLSGDEIQPLAPMEVDFGRPQWVLHLINYAFLDATRIAAAGADRGRWRLYVIDTVDRAATPLPLPYTECGSVVRARHGRVVFDAASPFEPRSVVEVDPVSGEATVLGRVQATVAVDRRYLSEPEDVVFDSDGQPTHAFFYPPRNPDFQAPAGSRPPLLVRAHGGPTAATSAMLDYAVQFWTSRGVAVLDVNYGGSSGYGRAYRRRLAGRWGELDAADCCAGARYLAARGDVDSDRLIIQGGSAGGLTVLSALAFHDTFHLGISYYGIADLEVFARDTHKFEAHYCDRLVGPYPAERETYRHRSPLHSAHRVARPLLMFQGLDDPVVPADQARAMFEALRDNGVPCGYLEFEHEQHGFRIDRNIHRCIRAELYFAGRVLGFGEPRDDAPVRIENEAALTRSVPSSTSAAPSRDA